MSKTLPNIVAAVIVVFAFIGYLTVLHNTLNLFVAPADKLALGALPASKNDGASTRLFWGLVPQTPTDPKYRTNHRFIVEAVGESDVDETCGPEPAAACANPYLQRVVVPNPCLYPDDPYAGLLCHEMAHLKGWEHEKGRESWSWVDEDGE